MQESKKRKLDEDNSPTFTCSVYAMNGIRICRHAFAAIVELNPATVNRHARYIWKSLKVEIYNTDLHKRRLYIQTSQTVLAKTFLENYGDEHGLVCPTKPGSVGDHPVLFLHSDVTRECVRRRTFCQQSMHLISLHHQMLLLQRTKLDCGIRKKRSWPVLQRWQCARNSLFWKWKLIKIHFLTDVTHIDNHLSSDSPYLILFASLFTASQ